MSKAEIIFLEFKSHLFAYQGEEVWDFVSFKSKKIFSPKLLMFLTGYYPFLQNVGTAVIGYNR